MVVWREMGGYAGTDIDRDQKGTTKRKKSPKTQENNKINKIFPVYLQKCKNCLIAYGVI